MATVFAQLRFWNVSGQLCLDQYITSYPWSNILNSVPHIPLPFVKLLYDMKGAGLLLTLAGLLFWLKILLQCTRVCLGEDSLGDLATFSGGKFFHFWTQFTNLILQKNEIEKMKSRESEGSQINCSGDGQFDSRGKWLFKYCAMQIWSNIYWTLTQII